MAKTGRCGICGRAGSPLRVFVVGTEPIPFCRRHFEEMESIGAELFFEKYDMAELLFLAWGMKLHYTGRLKKV